MARTVELALATRGILTRELQQGDPAMKAFLALVVMLTCAATFTARAQAPVLGEHDPEKRLSASDPKLAANKRLVYDFWREVFESGHVELAPKYMTESYIQHNPLVVSGRAPFVDFLSKYQKPKPIEPKVA